jgi:hypothetical protein
MIAAGVGVDLRRPPELAPRDYQGRFQQAALLQVLDQRRIRPVEARQKAQVPSSSC